MHIRSLKKICLYLMMMPVLLMISCEKGDDNSNLPPLRDLNLAYKKWKDSEISTYTYKIARRDCECDGRTYEVSVVNHAIISVKNAQGNQIQSIDGFKTIDGLFTLIDSSLKKAPHQAQITYDPIYGYPLDIYIDHIEQMADEEDSYIITDFKK